MTNPIEELFKSVSKETRYPPNSRYQRIETASIETADGRKIVFLKRRFVPAAEQFALVQEHPVVEGDRLDNLAQTYFGDPELFWRICDANNAMSPDELTDTTGRKLRITLPEGVPGNPNA